jgi:hypothetical protein
MDAPIFAIATEDPLGIGTIDGSSAINVANVNGTTKNNFHETMAGNGQYLEAAVKLIKPVGEFQVDYELLDGAEFSIACGVLVNSLYVVTALSASTSAESRPTVSVTVLQPSAPAMLRAYENPIEIEMEGGFGVVEKWGMASTGSFISTTGSVAMQTADTTAETGGDYLDGGLYYFGFKFEVTAEAYSAITAADYHVTDLPERKSKEGWKIHSVSAWKYLDAIAAVPGP